MPFDPVSKIEIPKRTIEKFEILNSNVVGPLVVVLSDDGKLFVGNPYDLANEKTKWRLIPDLPQEDL
jgi:hypothetical protein